MSSYESDFYQYVKFTFKAKDYSGATKVVYVGNRTAYDETTINIIPGLESVRGLSTGLNGNLPKVGSGQIVINNERGLFGTNKRFSDYFDKYTLIYTDVEIYTNFNTATDSSTVSSGATKLWVDKVLTVSERNGKVNISLRTDLIPEHTLTAVIDTDTFPSAPESAIGKTVPLVINDDVQVKPIRIADSGFTFGTSYAYATTLADDFVNGGVDKIFARDKDGNYQRVSSSTTAYYLPEYGYEQVGAGASTAYSSDNQAGQALKFTTSATTGVVAVGIRMDFYKSASGPTDEVIRGGLFLATAAGNAPGEMIAQTSEVVSSDLANGWNDSKAQVPSSLVFETPVVLAPNTTYYFGVWSNYRDDSGTPTNRLEYDLASSSTMIKSYYIIDSGTSTGEGYWAKDGNTANNLAMGLYCIHLNSSGTTVDYPSPTASYINSDGLGFSRFVTTSYLAHYTERVDFIFSVNGIRDDGSGALTGSAGIGLGRVFETPALLSATYNGSSWVSGKFDETAYNYSHSGLNLNTHPYHRIARGATRGKVTAKQILQQICEEHVLYIARKKGADSYGVYIPANVQSDAATILDTDVIGEIDYEVQDRTGVVSHVRSSFHRKLTSTNFIDVVVQGGDSTFNNYAEYTDSDISGLFGEVESKRKTYSWVYDVTSMDNLNQLRTERGGLPNEVIVFSVEYKKFGDLEMFDTFKISHPALPSELGTDPDPRPTNADADTDLTGNNQWLTAKPYRAQIMGIDYEFERQVPQMRITARLLINPKEVI